MMGTLVVKRLTLHKRCKQITVWITHDLKIQLNGLVEKEVK